MDTLRIIITIAWRNLWRSKVRSSVVIIAMAMGIWASIFLTGFSIGMNDQRTDSALSTYLGFAQVHAEGWKEDAAVELTIPNVTAVETKLEEQEGYVAHSSRIVQNGSVSSSYGMMGVQIEGVDPATDTLVCDLNTRIIEGEYLPETRRVPMAYVGESLAKELKLELGSRLPIGFQHMDGYPTEALFRVGGIFKTVSTAFDKSTVQIRKEDFAALMGGGPSMAHEIIVKLDDKEKAREYASAVDAMLPDVIVESWQEVSPDLGYADDMMAFSLYIFIGIIIFAITFGILNTMLMAILERRRELGMLMAVGMNKRRTFFMIMVETLFLGCVGAPIGILIGHVSLLISGKTGFDLSAVGEGLSAYGMDSFIYPVPVPGYYLGISVIVVTLTLLASLVPAFRALKLNPVEAIRTV